MSLFTSIIIFTLHIIPYKQYLYCVSNLIVSLTFIGIYDLIYTAAVFEGELEYLVNTICIV